jgi:hypothetical protein
MHQHPGFFLPRFTYSTGTPILPYCARLISRCPGTGTVIARYPRFRFTWVGVKATLPVTGSPRACLESIPLMYYRAQWVR